MSDVNWRPFQISVGVRVGVGLAAIIAGAGPSAASCEWLDAASAAKFSGIAADCPVLLAGAEPAVPPATAVIVARPASVAIRFGNLSQRPRVGRRMSDRFASGQAMARVSVPGSAGLIDAVAASHRIDPLLLDAIVARESAGRADAVSAKGAIGLMQVMPATARALGVADPATLRDPATGLVAGATYLKQMQARFGSNLALTLAAYNAGPGAVARAGGVPPYAETRAYVAAILARYRAARAASRGVGVAPEVEP